MEAMLLKVPEVAVRLGMSRAKVYELMASGALRSVRVDGCRRVRTEDLVAFVAYLDEQWVQRASCSRGVRRSRDSGRRGFDLRITDLFPGERAATGFDVVTVAECRRGRVIGHPVLPYTRLAKTAPRVHRGFQTHCKASVRWPFRSRYPTALTCQAATWLVGQASDSC